MTRRDDPAKIVHFTARAARQTLGSCDEWEGHINEDGYGTVWFEGRHQLVHRVIWKIVRGPIQDGLVLDHVLQNVYRNACSRSCINLLHLALATSKENTLRGRGPAARNARLARCKHGHPFTARPGGRGRICRTCARARYHNRRNHAA